MDAFPPPAVGTPRVVDQSVRSRYRVTLTWLHESNAQRVNRAIAVSACNAAMCMATLLLILLYRL